VDQSTFVTRIANRLNIDSSDPLYASLGDFVDEALHYLETSSAEGYPWYRQTVTLTTTANDRDYAFSELAALTTGTVGVSRINDVSVLYQTNQWIPLDLINPETADMTYGDTRTGIPEAWYAEGQTLYLYPTPNAAYSTRVRVNVVEADLGASTSSPVLPVVFHQAVIDAALLVCYQQLQDVQRMDIQERKVEKWVDRMKRYGTEYARAPKVTVRDPLNI
jgi:hypothetical protein